MSGANLDPESRKCQWPECLSFDSPPHPKALTQRGFMSPVLTFHPIQVPQLFPASFPFQRSIYRLQNTGLSLGTSSVNKHSIPATNLVTFGKSSRNRWKSKCLYLLTLHFQTIGLLLILCHPWAEGRPGTACAFRASFPRPEEERPSCGL